MITTTGIPFFGCGNSKLPDSTLTFALPSGHTCPGALECLARAERVTGTITDGPDQLFRCYEASIESLRPSVRSRRWANYDLLRGRRHTTMAELLLAGIAAARDHKTTHVRWFTGGDFYSKTLRDAILLTARSTPDLIHYAYTKNLPLFAPTLQRVIVLPDNFRLTASWGGRFDHLIQAGLFARTARVLNTREQAQALGLTIDVNDRLAWQDEPTHFCHLTHGQQPAGSVARMAITARRKQGDFTGYGSRRKCS